MPGKPHPDRYPGKLPRSGWCMSPEPGQCYFLGNYKPHRMKAMTARLGQGGRPCQKVGVGREPGRRGRALAGFAQTYLFSFPDWKELFGLCTFAESHGLYYTSWLPPQLPFCHSVKTQLVFFMRRAEQTVGSLPPMSCSKAHHK